MSKILDTLKSYCKGPIPERLYSFFTSEVEKYNDCKIANLPGWDPESTFGLKFSKDTIEELQERHGDWIADGSANDRCEYIAFSSLIDLDYEDKLTDFIAVNISDENCPVYFGNHENGQFEMIYNSLDYFLAYLDKEEAHPMEGFTSLYESAKSAFYNGDNEQVIEGVAPFFEQHEIDPSKPGPYMKEIPDALNLLACAYYDRDQPNQALAYLDQACKGFFCRNAYLNRAKFIMVSSDYERAMEQCNQGLERFSDDYATSFLNLYRGVIYGILERYDDAQTCFDLMTGNVEKSDFDILTPVAAVYTHYTESDDFEMVFNKVATLIKESE
ncbi:tetratricopeptide repeat protein [Reichenbachiella agariperforans]|uniref:tetratricopeptide repeat protein n=1 Tax=Reichenbachiella agariperforans TaxID=156994 RepID=UPI001C0A207B|nr:hypothetical protein [Reichenbachiella agariperforans]MBU2915305.1 hypothetical protein [Reichenbachiella agariperforans]